VNLELKKTTLLMTVIILSLKDLKVPFKNSYSAVINREYENKTVFLHFKISKRELVARNPMYCRNKAELCPKQAEHKTLCRVNDRLKFEGRII